MIHTQQEEGRGVERENDLHHLGHSCPEVLCPKSRNERMGICCPLSLSPRVEYLHHLDDSMFKIVCITQNDPTNEACISPFTRQRKNKRKTCALFTAGLFMSFFFLTLFKPKPCVRCDFHDFHVPLLSWPLCLVRHLYIKLHSGH